MSDRRLERRAAARRRPPANNSFSGPRPDRVAAWAFLLGVLLVLLAATSSQGQTGGVPPPGAAPVPRADGTPAGQEPQLGERLLGMGSSGSDVKTLQLILAARGYGPLQATGIFESVTESAVKRFQRDAGLAVDGLVGPQTRPVLLRLMRVRLATWYGPGLYGRRTACGEQLGPRTFGVAHRSLPCGTPVTFYRGGRFVTVPVIDRGPFRRGVAWDLTAATAQAIGLQSTARLRSLH